MRFGRCIPAFCILLAAVPAAAAPHRPQVYPNSAITILAITQGPDGFLWLAAEDGLYRFDGFHYQKIPGFPFGSARCIEATPDGSLWIGGREGLVRYRHQTFDILLREEVHSLAALSDGVAVRQTARVTKIKIDGSSTVVAANGREYLTRDPSGGVWFIPLQSASRLDPDTLRTVQTRPVPPDYDQVAVDFKGRTWIANASKAVELDASGRPVRALSRLFSQRTQRPPPLLPGRNGELWFIGETVRGLVTGRGFADRALRDEYQPTAAYEDQRGHVWVARLGLGLVEWIPDPGWERWFPESFAQEPGLSVTRSADGSVIAATHKNLYRLDGDQWTRLTRQTHDFEYVLPLPQGGYVASIRDRGLVRLTRAGDISASFQMPGLSPREFRVLLRDSRGRIWSGHKGALSRLDVQTGSLHTEALPQQTPGGAEAVDLEEDSAGQVWAGFVDGLAWLDSADRWHKLPTSSPVAAVRSFTLADGKGEDIWVAHRTPGAFSRLRKQGDVWKVTRFDPAAGYEPADTHFLKRDSRGWIWRGAPDGVHISDGIHVEPNDWIHISLADGLSTDSTDMYGFFEDQDASIWISGEQGVTHLHPDASWFEAPRGAAPPAITRVQVDDREYSPSSTIFPAVFPRDAAHVSIDAGSLQAPPFRDAALRYRLRPGPQDWRLVMDGTIDLSHPPPAAYTLEIAYAGSVGSPVSRYEFRVGPGGFSVSSGFGAFSGFSAAWYWVVSLSLGAGALVWLFRRAPAMARARYGLDKNIFLLGQRLRPEQGAPPAAEIPAPDLSGEILAERYELIGRVSRGGFSVVYEALDRKASQNGGRVAVKVLKRSAGHDGWLRERFAHEVAALSSIRHPGVVTVLDSWIGSDGVPCLVMPFLDGPTLSAALEQGPFPCARAARLTRGIAGALAEIHGRGVVHRDLKPENIMLLSPASQEERPVLIDFGTAGLRGTPGEPSTTTLLAGSFHYMAPERLIGHYSAASDVYAFGIMTLEMLTGKRLGDVAVPATEDGFVEELARLLAPVMGEERGAAAAALLAPAYASKPQARPSDVRQWGDQLAVLLDGA